MEVADRGVHVDRLDRVAADEVDALEHLRQPAEVLVVGAVAGAPAAIEVARVGRRSDGAEREPSPPMCSECAGFHECSVNSAGAVTINCLDHRRVERHLLLAHGGAGRARRSPRVSGSSTFMPMSRRMRSEAWWIVSSLVRRQQLGRWTSQPGLRERSLIGQCR